jgi:hypothetical protein
LEEKMIEVLQIQRNFALGRIKGIVVEESKFNVNLEAESSESD